MLRNNLTSLIIHIFVGTISYVFLYLIYSLFVITVGGGQTLFIIGDIMTFIISLILYFILGRRFLKRYSSFKSIFSVSAVAIIGVGIWIFIYDFPYSTYEVVGIDHGLLYFLYNMYICPLFQQFKSRSPLILIWFSFLPSLLMWCGVQYKRGNKHGNYINITHV